MSKHTEELIIFTLVLLVVPWAIYDSWKHQRVVTSGGVTISREKYPFFFWFFLLTEAAAILFSGWFVLSWLFKGHLSG